MVKRPEGCTMLHIAKQTISEAGVITYETPERLYGLEEITCTNNYAEGAAYSDNQQDTNIKRPSFVDLAIVVRELPPKIEAKIMGKRYIDGKKITNTKDTAPVFAVLYQQTNSDGSYTDKVFYNCNLAKDETVNTTIKDGIEYDVVSITGKAIPLPNGDLDLELESDGQGVTKEELNSFFTRVMMPPAIEETKIETKK